MKAKANKIADTGATPDPAADIQNVTLISIDALEVWSGNSRNGTEEGLEELATSIKAQGILQPILVRRTNNETRAAYEIICGKRRYKAAMLADLDLIPCYVRKMDDSQAANAVATENIQREDFTPWDAYLAVTHALNLHKTPDAAAIALGKSVGWTRRVASLSDLAGIWCQTAKAHPQISLAFLERVARLPEAVQQDVWDNHGGEFEQGGNFGTLERTESQALASIELQPWLANNHTCEGCSRRTDVQHELFPELAKERPMCLDPDCREKRRLDYIEAQKAKAAKTAKVTVAQIQTTDHKRYDDSTAKTKTNTVPIVVAQGPMTGTVVWRKPDQEGGNRTDATPKGPTPEQRAAAVFIRDVTKQVDSGDLLERWAEQANTNQLLAAAMVYGIRGERGTAQDEYDAYKRLCVGCILPADTIKAEIAGRIRSGVLGCLRFDKVSDCAEQYEYGKQILNIFDI